MRRLSLLILFLASAAAAQAEDKPVIAPPAAWVKPTPIPKPKNDAGGVYRLLLMDQQVNFDTGGDQFYLERAIRVQNAMGLTGLGNIAISWNPELDAVRVHKVQIRRGDQVIDILAKQAFTILRREPNLEYAALDGQLTATVQAEGLQVGDVLDVAYTITHHDPAMMGRSDTIMDGLSRTTADRAVMRVVWDSPKAMAWRAAGGMQAPSIAHHGKTTEVLVDRRDLTPIEMPSMAPQRFQRGWQLEFSEFAAWADVSATMAPLYDKASKLAADSPLKGEVAKIKAASNDPKVQASAALALVEKKTRYLYLGMKDGGLVPADADLTWSRKFGDCKGKTVLLLALLRELGIEALPALVSSTGGDGLDARLPSMAPFDHVIVQATIGGQTYWLDGTRTEDRGVDTLRTPGFYWALPVKASGAELMKLTRSTPDEPQSVTTIRVDASGGLDAPAPTHIEVVDQSEAAAYLQMMFASLATAERDKFLRKAWESRYPWLKVATVTGSYDEATGRYRQVVDGVATLPWLPPGASGYRFLTIADAALGWNAEFKREPGPFVDAPFVVGFPAYSKVVETIVLPRGGTGFTAPAPDVDVKVAGQAFYRRSRLEKGVFTVERSQRSLVAEFPASEAGAAAAQLKELAKTVVYVRSPAGYVATDKDMAALSGAELKTAQEYIGRGSAYMKRREYAKAVADFDKAVNLDPKNSYGLSNRGIARFWNNELPLAKADFQAAAKLDPRDFVAVQGAGLVAAYENRNADAVAAFSRAIDLRADNVFALLQRAHLYRVLNDDDRALADVAEILRIEPQATDARMMRIDVLRQRNDLDGALAEIEAGLKAAPEDRLLPVARASLLSTQGRKVDAAKAFEEALNRNPTVEGYLTRANTRDKADRAGRMADLEAALKLEPKSTPALAMRAALRSEMGANSQAIAELTQALKLQPDNNGLLVGRAQAYARAGQLALADKDFSTVRAKTLTNAWALNNLCWTRATLGVLLDAALADCQAALEISPQSPEILDSRAFVLLRLGRFDQATADYDAALKLRPRSAPSLYGRGVAKLRLQKATEGEADLAAARAISTTVDAEFAGYGVTP